MVERSFIAQYTYIDVVANAISLFGVVTNGLLLFAIFKDPLKCFRNSGTYFVINLSVSDYLTSFFAPVFDIEIYIIAGTYSIFKMLVVWLGVASLLSLASISIDRYLMVAYPFKHRFLRKGKVILPWLTAVWVVSCVASVLTGYFGWRRDRNHVFTFCGIIIILMAFIYALTYHKLKQQSRNIALQTSIKTDAQMMRILKEKQFLKTIIIIACIAFVCVVPSMIFFQISCFLGFIGKDITSRKIFISIFYINFAVNPLIYILRLPKYRKTFYLVYWKRRY